MSTHVDSTRKKLAEPAKPMSASHNSSRPLASFGTMVQRAQANPDLLSSQEVLQLQSSMGNQAVQRLLQSPKGGQSQFRVGPMHDHFEAEADRVAGESSSVQRSSEGKSS